jgi:hypothetical protein
MEKEIVKTVKKNNLEKEFLEIFGRINKSI